MTTIRCIVRVDGGTSRARYVIGDIMASSSFLKTITTSCRAFSGSGCEHRRRCHLRYDGSVDLQQQQQPEQQQQQQHQQQRRRRRQDLFHHHQQQQQQHQQQQRTLSSFASLASQKVQAIMEWNQPWTANNAVSLTTTTSTQPSSSPLSSSSSLLSSLSSSSSSSSSSCCPNNSTGHGERLPSGLMGHTTSRKTTDGTGWIVRPIKTTSILRNHDPPMAIRKIQPDSVYILRVWGHTTQQCGGAGIGLVLVDPLEGNEVWSSRIYCRGDRTIFESEYTAIIMGMDYCLNVLGVRRIIIQCTNRPIVRQMHGVYSARSSLEQLNDIATSLGKQFSSFHIQHVCEDENMRAKSLANTALATRKSIFVDDQNNWLVEQRDPMSQVDVRNKVARWKQPDHPAISCTIDSTKTYLLQFDGGSRSDSIGMGMVMYDGSQEIWSGWKYHRHHASNNVAEYLGALYGLKAASSLGVKRLILEGDSLLIVQQLNGKRQTREKYMDTFKEKALEYMSEFDDVEIRHIYRRHNARADWLANFAMDNAESGGFIYLDDDDDDDSLIGTVRETEFVA